VVWPGPFTVSIWKSALAAEWRKPSGILRAGRLAPLRYQMVEFEKLNCPGGLARPVDQFQQQGYDALTPDRNVGFSFGRTL